MPRGQGRGGGPLPRSVLVSKALSRLLRHAAVEERIPIDNHGYVRMDHLLGWQRLRSMKPPVDFAEVVQVVRGNEKNRFALKFTGDTGNGVGVDMIPVAGLGREDSGESEAQTDNPTQRALTQFESTESKALDAKQFFIRATQGHSMKDVEAENLLTPISLDDPASIPDVVVHGTFYGSWEEILRSGGLKSMRRNHVHFASGPRLDEVLPSADLGALGGGQDSHDANTANASQAKEHGPATSKRLGDVLGKNKVISGMRSDAQILIYIDVRRALSEEPSMKWWKSENGVILTDAIVPTPSMSPGTDENSVTDNKEKGQPDGGSKNEMENLVPTKYFLAAVEIKEGIGLLYNAAKGGVVQTLPEHLRGRGVPRGKGGGPRGGRGGRSGRRG